MTLNNCFLLTDTLSAEAQRCWARRRTLRTPHKPSEAATKDHKVSVSKKGFTLIEIMIVLLIIGVVVGLAIPKLTNSKNKQRDEVRRIARISKDVHNASKLENKTYRMVFELDPKKAQYVFSLESAEANTVLLNADQLKKLQNVSDPKKSLIAKNNGFEKAKSILPEAHYFPKDFFIDKIELSDGTFQVEGPVYIHYFSQGTVQEAAIHLSNHKTLNWTIYINPITARATIYDKEISLKEISNR